MQRVGLVLSGGGARGAYQAGVIAAIAEVCSRYGVDNPFQIMSGVSAGAINSCVLGCYNGGLLDASRYLTKIWSEISTDEVFYADLMALSRGGLEWVTDISFTGRKSKRSQIRSLFSTHPMRSLLSEACPFPNLTEKIRAGTLHALSVSALEYENLTTRTFFQGHPSIDPWERPMHRSEACDLAVDHIMASTAIPLLFPPAPVGTRYYADGSIRNQSPCSPAIYLGADKLVAIGVRKRQETTFSYHYSPEEKPPSMARIANVIFHSMMMDGIELDIQRISQTNSYLSLLSEEDRERLPVRSVDFCWIAPSIDFAQFAVRQGSELPRMVRYILKGPGTLEEAGELTSFLLFEPGYCKQLIEVGFTDGMKEQEQIKRLLIPD